MKRMEPVSPIVSQLHEALTDKFRSKQAPVSEPVDDPVQAARSDLDREIEAVEIAFRAYEAYSLRELKGLCLRRNRLAPISRLPNEILSSAFRLVVQSFRKYTEGIRALFTISSVCRAWRDVALECPMLWTRLERSPPPLLSLFLARSKQAPLDIVFGEELKYSPEDDLSKHIDLTSLHAHRWGTVILRYLSFDEIARSLLPPAPHLEVLDLHCGPHPYAPGSGSLYRFPHPFADHTPSLRELTLGAILIPSMHPIYCNLVKLGLRMIEYGKPDLLRELFQVFEASPLLEELNLASLTFSFSSVVGPPGLIDLPRPQALRAADLRPGWASKYFISHFSLPSSVYLEVIGDLDSGVDVSTFLPAYSRTHPNLPDLSSTTSLGIQVQDCACGVSGSALEKELFLFEFTADPLDDMAALILDLGRVFPMPLLDSVEFSDFDLGDPDEANLGLAAACRDFLDRHSTIKDPVFDNCHESMLEILSTATPSLVCPQLQTLTIRNCLLSPKRLIEMVKLRTTPSSAEAENGSGSEADDERLLRVDIRRCPQFTKAHLSTLRKRVEVNVYPRHPNESD
ncbi:hypothetical protein BOTBODRAFT_382777 [Botryobasidium botryosum FD-172 SS1]|uniref:F-box domain-containing protein n=1 Tax=Botryobasidium botryosum (strain FD-172 SS1) TaxID=930990 RepID=A0A067MWI6_BOTB1|nr:hypothetical protein BOTBODRAFT_382777 [Botryobasidium botryosum FD-172 SS1]